MPVYCGYVSFGNVNSPLCHERITGAAIAWASCHGQTITIRVGFDLFNEVGFLLQKGQPEEYATVPTLDLHIAFIRSLIVGCGIGLVEIPPRPAGHTQLPRKHVPAPHPRGKQELEPAERVHPTNSGGLRQPIPCTMT